MGTGLATVETELTLLTLSVEAVSRVDLDASGIYGPARASVLTTAITDCGCGPSIDDCQNTLGC